MTKKLVMMVLLLAFLASCASRPRVHYFQSDPDYPRTSARAVDLLRDEPRRPHDAFAEIRFEPPARMHPREVEWKLREKGAAIGADALVIEVDNFIGGSTWVIPARSRYRGRAVPRGRVHTRLIIAVAIRYR